MIKSFKEYITEEVSKNDPIPKITRFSEKVDIILLGTPGAGKTEIFKNFPPKI